MIEYLSDNEVLLIGLGIFSAITFVASLFLVPFLVVRLPADYFDKENRHKTLLQQRHPVIRLLLLIIRNVAGIMVLLLGIAMLILPGQGLLTIFIAVMLIDFPGKYRLQRWLIQRPSIYRAVAWLREKAGREPLII